MKTLEGYQVVLRPIEESDLETLRQWRNSDVVRAQMVSQSHISASQQRQWFESLSTRHDQMHWVIDYKGVSIGSANVRSADPRNACLHAAKQVEPGLYIGKEQYRGNVLAFAPSLLLNDFCFETLVCQRLVAKVKLANQAAIKYNQQLGYELHTESIDEQGVGWAHIALTPEHYEQKSQALKAFFQRGKKKALGH